MTVSSPDPLLSVVGKRVLITGGARGIGRMLARGFVERGAHVILTSRDETAAATAAAELSRLGSCTALFTDLTPESLPQLVESIDQLGHGGLDVLVNNAALTHKAPLAEHSDDLLHEVFDVDFVTPFRLIRELLPLLRYNATAESPSKIINIGSIGALTFRLYNNFGYVAAKAGLHAVSRQLALVLAQDHITVNVVAPGPFASDMAAGRLGSEGLANVVHGIPMGRMGGHDDIVGAAIYLASAAGNYVTATMLRVDGGTSNLNSALERGESQ